MIRSVRGWLCGGLIVGIFAADVAVARGVTIPVAYVAPLLLIHRWHGPRVMVAMAVACTIATVFGAVASPDGGSAPWVVFANRGCTVFAIWMATSLSVKTYERLAQEARRVAAAEDTTKAFARQHVAEAQRARAMASMMEDLAHERARFEASDLRFRATIEYAPMAMVMIDRDGTIVLVNSETERLFQYDRAELLGKPIETLVPERFRDAHVPARAEFLAEPKARRMGSGRDLYARRKDGGEFPVEIGLNPLLTDEGVFVLSAIADVTERKRYESKIESYARELERSNRELDRFAYSASHDLKAPLRAVDSLATFVLEDSAASVSEESRSDLLLMRQRIKRMERLLDDLLDYSRVGRERGDRERVDLDEVVASIVEMIEPPAGFEVVTRDLPTVETDRAPLAQVLQNLIGNAIKHHDREQGRIQVDGRVVGNELQVSIADDGPGIEPEFHDRVFRMFQTLRPRDEVDGSGMGLAIVKKTLEFRGGGIELHSEGRGTAFRIRWPLSAAEANVEWGEPVGCRE